jgi:hypothetical protein
MGGVGKKGLPNQSVWSKWFAISNLSPIRKLSLSLMGGVGKEGLCKQSLFGLSGLLLVVSHLFGISV